MITADLRRRARENGLFFPPDPGSAEQSQLGGNIATNAGGPHAFKYGVTGAWITGLEFVLAPGELVRVGGPIRKDVAGYDLKSLMIGSEGTLGIVTAAWVKMIPAPEAALPAGRALPGHAPPAVPRSRRCSRSGIVPAAIEYLDEGSIEATRGAFPVELPDDARFMVLADADGTRGRGGPRPRGADRGPERGRACSSTPRPAPKRSTRCGAGATAPRSPSPPSAAARSPRTSSFRSTGSGKRRHYLARNRRSRRCRSRSSTNHHLRKGISCLTCSIATWPAGTRPTQARPPRSSPSTGARTPHYIDPLVEVEGREALDATIAAVQQQFPGFVFTAAGPVDAHHRQARFSWGLGPAGCRAGRRRLRRRRPRRRGPHRHRAGLPRQGAGLMAATLTARRRVPRHGRPAGHRCSWSSPARSSPSSTSSSSMSRCRRSRPTCTPVRRQSRSSSPATG